MPSKKHKPEEIIGLAHARSRSCWARAARPRRHAGASGTVNKPVITGGKSMAKLAYKVPVMLSIVESQAEVG